RLAVFSARRKKSCMIGLILPLRQRRELRVGLLGWIEPSRTYLQDREVEDRRAALRIELNSMPKLRFRLGRLSGCHVELTEGQVRVRRRRHLRSSFLQQGFGASKVVVNPFHLSQGDGGGQVLREFRNGLLQLFLG